MVVLGGLFVILQVILLIGFAYKWNETWSGYDQKKWYAAILFVCVLCYAGFFAFFGVMVEYYGGGGCDLQNAFMAITFIFAVLVTGLSMKVAHGALLPSAVICLYCGYVCWSAVNGIVQTAIAFRGATKMAFSQGWVWYLCACHLHTRPSVLLEARALCA